ncbi:hypothetical protein ACH47X_19210 [Promicromonospora kroppenstedtii]|uniref:Uncharacterized protein n=1 Tax=Promicromonospora kroppenstedtii TaxID=440482 RepID=A0ABW7XNG7_9MICO
MQQSLPLLTCLPTIHSASTWCPTPSDALPTLIHFREALRLITPAQAARVAVQDRQMIGLARNIGIEDALLRDGLSEADLNDETVSALASTPDGPGRGTLPARRRT